ncbi:MAG: TOMM precursor leader peptide-binding protein [Mycobacteriales bacterium]
MRPVLAPAARRHWRDPQTLQLGCGPVDAVVLEGLGPDRRLVLPLLDGTRTREEVLLAAQQQGCADTEQVLSTLEQAGLILDADALHPVGLERGERDRLAPDLAALSLTRGGGASQALLGRRQARVLVQGAGRVGAALATLLGAAGVGTVDVRDPTPVRTSDTGPGGLDPDEVGRRRDEVLMRRLRTVGSHRHPDLVVLTEDDAEGTGAVLVRDGTPHLLARVQERLGVVGPLVLPGSSPCLTCLDLVRSAIDPQWPVLAAQRDHPRPGPVACDTVLAAAVASQAALQVLQLLEGDTPASVGGTLELHTPGWRWRRRTWPKHPGCPCAWARAQSA